MIDINVNKSASFSKAHIAVIIVISFVLGVLTQRYILEQETFISYISQSEMLELEKARLKGEDLVNRQLFLGEPARAIELIEGLQSKRTSKHNIILISEKSIYGKNVKSISEEVHKEILKHLEDEKAKNAK